MPCGSTSPLVQTARAYFYPAVSRLSSELASVPACRRLCHGIPQLAISPCPAQWPSWPSRPSHCLRRTARSSLAIRCRVSSWASMAALNGSFPPSPMATGYFALPDTQARAPGTPGVGLTRGALEGAWEHCVAVVSCQTPKFSRLADGPSSQGSQGADRRGLRTEFRPVARESLHQVCSNSAAKSAATLQRKSESKL